jgi:predicted transglutaminase-like cysteine proteinase
VGFKIIRASKGTLPRVGLKPVLGIAAMSFAVMAIGAKAHADEIVTHWTMPQVAVPEADRPFGPSVLGTVALPVRAKPTSTRWSKLMMASLDQPGLISLTAGASELPRQEQAAFVQSAVKHTVRSRPFSFNCSDDGYWAPAGETLARGMGDCFDIAIAKMEALRFLGIPSKDLYLTTGRFRTSFDTGAERESVALLVRIDDHFWLLTEQSEQIIEAGSAPDDTADFTPIVTYGVGLTWVHGRLVKLASLGQ